jgi:hypothetical protein
MKQDGGVIMNRTQDYYRHQRQRIINRKKKIVKQYYGFNYYTHDGQYNKGKIHCSCWMCSTKTKVHGLSRTDMRKKAQIQEQENEISERVPFSLT